MSICAFPAHDLHVTVSRTRVTLALAPGRALEGNNTVGNWKTVTVPPLQTGAPLTGGFSLLRSVILLSMNASSKALTACGCAS